MMLLLPDPWIGVCGDEATEIGELGCAVDHVEHVVASDQADPTNTTGESGVFNAMESGPKFRRYREENPNG